MRRSCLPIAALVLFACGPSITVTRDAAIPMPGAATYVWGPPPQNVPNEKGVIEQSPVIRQRIKTAIDNGLQAKGYRLTDSSQATFLVRYAMGSRFNQTQVTNDVVTGAGLASPNACGGASCWTGWDYGWYGVQTRDVQTRQSGVVVDLVELKSGTLAWRGIYAKEDAGKVPTQEAVQEAVEKLFAKLPAVGK